MDKKDVIRCSNCRKIIGEGGGKDYKIAIKCKCGTLNVLEAIPKEKIETRMSNASLNLGTFSIQHISEP